MGTSRHIVSAENHTSERHVIGGNQYILDIDLRTSQEATWRNLQEVNRVPVCVRMSCSSSRFSGMPGAEVAGRIDEFLLTLYNSGIVNTEQSMVFNTAPMPGISYLHSDQVASQPEEVMLDNGKRLISRSFSITSHSSQHISISRSWQIDGWDGRRLNISEWSDMMLALSRCSIFPIINPLPTIHDVVASLPAPDFFAATPPLLHLSVPAVNLRLEHEDGNVGLSIERDGRYGYSLSGRTSADSIVGLLRGDRSALHVELAGSLTLNEVWSVRGEATITNESVEGKFNLRHNISPSAFLQFVTTTSSDDPMRHLNITFSVGGTF